MGGSSDPSVLRSPGATPQKGRAAHGPRHPAVIIPLRLCLLDVCLLLGVSWVFVWLLVWVSWSSGLKCCLVWCPLRSAPCLLDVCVPSFFLLLFGTFADDVLVSFFLSLRRWGNPNPVWGLGFPLCSLPLGRGLRLRSVPLAQHIHLGIAPAPVFFFSLRRRRRRWSVGWYCGGRLRSCSGFFVLWWWVVVLGLSVPFLHCMQDVLGAIRPGQKDETSFAPCRVATMMFFLGILGGDQ